MKILAFDTSSKLVSVALFENERLVSSFDSEQSLNEQSRVLLPEIERLIKDAKWTAKEIDALYIGVGPGSFTGLRMGMALAKAWSLTKKMKFYKFSSGVVSKVKDLEASHLTEVSDIEQLVPVYANDHFS